MANFGWYFGFGVALLISLNLGCNGPDAVNAKPRGESNRIAIVSEAKANESARNDFRGSESANASLDTRFIKPDHFGCVIINVTRILGNKEIGDLPWSEFESLMAEWVGDQNAKLNLIDRVWVLLDREFFQLGQGASGADSPVIYVVEYKHPIDSKSIPARPVTDSADTAVAENSVAKETVSSHSEDTRRQASTTMVSRAIDERRIAIGSRKAIDKLNIEVRERSPLVGEVHKFNLEMEMVGSVTTSPIRSTLRSIIELAAGFNAETKKLVDLPDELRSVDLHLNLESNSDFFGMDFKIENENLRKDLCRLFSDSMNSGRESGSPAMPMGGLGALSDRSKQMIETQSGDVIQAVGKEIAESNLFSVKEIEDTIQIRLARPVKFSELVQAVAADANKQIELQKRVSAMKKIANALKAYESKNGSLPSATPVAPGGDHPPQFSWRVALLPEMGYQDLYDEFDFTEPWDSEKNMQVAKKIPDEFRASADSIKSAIQIVTGENAMFNPNDAFPKIEDIRDLKIWTALIMESATAGEIWTQPRLSAGSPLNKNDFVRQGEQGTLIIDASFNVRALKTTEDSFQAVITTGGGERLGRASFFPIKTD